MKKAFILILTLIAASFALTACSNSGKAFAKEVSVDEIKDEKLRQMVELLNNKDGAHIYMAEKEFYLFLNASNKQQGDKTTEFGGLTVTYDEKEKVLTMDYVEKETEAKENIKNKVIYRIPVKEKPDRLKLLKNGESTPITTLSS